MSAPDLPPIPSTGDEEADGNLALLRSTTTAIHDAQEKVTELSAERQRLVLELRKRGVKYTVIAAAVPTTEQTIYKIHREAKAALRAAQRAAEQEAAQQGAAVS
jgi:DNA-binding NarL/FixJ family response regulator